MLHFPKENKAFSFTRRFFVVYLFSVSVNSVNFRSISYIIVFFYKSGQPRSMKWNTPFFSDSTFN